MLLNTITITDLVRNPKKVLDSLDEPVMVMRDSRPGAVMMAPDEYLKYKKDVRMMRSSRLKELLKGIHRRNVSVSDEELDRDIEEARNAVRGDRH